MLLFEEQNLFLSLHNARFELGGLARQHTQLFAKDFHLRGQICHLRLDHLQTSGNEVLVKILRIFLKNQKVKVEYLGVEGEPLPH